jgi:hypothetical protein
MVIALPNATAEGRKLGNLVHDQRKKFKAGTLSDDRISLLSDLEFDFSMQTNVVEKRLTVPIAISKIFKYKKEHGHVAVLNREPHMQLRRWIVHAKATSKKIIAQGSGNPKFTLPYSKLLHELGIIQLPPNFKLLEKNNNTVGNKEGEDEEDDEGTSKCKVYITRKGQGQGTDQTKDEIEDCSQENKQCTMCNGKGIHWTKEDIANSVEEHPDVIPSNTHFTKICSNCE